jgi:hypothetical protein
MTIISILHQVTALLETNAYVTLISLDFSKAFDTVRHSVLVDKLAQLEIPDAIFNWLANFLQDRKHVTRFNGQLSEVAKINASVIQGSGVGPSDFIVNASDLHPIYAKNKIVKYADDTYLIIGAEMRDTVRAELDGIRTWATQNNLKLNTSKSREMLIARGGKWKVAPPPLLDMERVASMVILGVTIRDDLRATSHVDGVLAACSGSLHALRVLRAHGLPSIALQEVARATTMTRLLFAAPAW